MKRGTMIFTKAFWAGAFERSVKTAAQTALAYIVIGTTGILDLDWVAVGSVVGAATLASVLTSLVSADFVAGKQDLTDTEREADYQARHARDVAEGR